MTTSAAPASDDIEGKLLKKLRSAHAALPVLPKAASAALDLAQNAHASLSDLSRLVDTDPPIAARFLSVVNSAAYFRGQALTTTESAIVRLGLAATRDLLFQAVYSSSAQGLKRFAKPVQTTFDRSVMTALAARVVGKELGSTSSYDYMCGLLHDIGEGRVYRILDAMSPPPSLVEAAALAARHHQEAGAEIAMMWKLPAEIVEACTAHHTFSASSHPAILITRIADAIIDLHLETRHPEEPLSPLDRLSEMGISEERATKLLESVRALLSRAS